MKIVIVTTPNVELKETGFGTLKACESIQEVLQKTHTEVELAICKNKKDLLDIVNRKPDLVILAVKYIQLEKNEKIWLSEFFGKRKIKFTGSNINVIKTASNKTEAKAKVRLKGIRTADYFVVTPNTYQKEEEISISFPLFLKPLDAANGNGIDDYSLVHNFAEYCKKIKEIQLKYDDKVLVEQNLEGREFTVSVLEDRVNGELIIAPIEIVPPIGANGIRILSEKVKKDDSEELKKVENGDVKEALKKMAMGVFEILEIKSYARIDIKMDGNGILNFMEVNVVPGMKKGSSYFPKAFEIDKNLEYKQIISLIVD